MKKIVKITTTLKKRSYLKAFIKDRNTFLCSTSKRFLDYDDNVRTNLCTVNGSDHRFLVAGIFSGEFRLKQGCFCH